MKKVLVGMSGGVDSSVSALLLKQAGYEVIGVTMLLCGQVNDTDAKKVCEKIGITHHTVDFRDEFKKRVIDSFVSCYYNGQTPNPCVECNRYLKFGMLYEKALELGCDYIATGHYAKTQYSEKYGQYVLKKAQANKKDQSYFLYGIKKEVLPKMIFPLKDMHEKEKVREIALSNELPVAEKQESQEICFIPDEDYVRFLKETTNKQDKQGEICLKDGTVLGKHKGIIHYTIGQRKGLGISYSEPLYVYRLDEATNRVMVGTKECLYTDTLKASKLNFLLEIDRSKPIQIKAKIRYRAKEAEAVLYPEIDGIVTVVFKEPQRAVTPGQSVVFYIDDAVLGGGKIL